MNFPLTFDDLEQAMVALDSLVWLVHQDSYDGEIIILDEIDGVMLLSTLTAKRQDPAQHSSLSSFEYKILKRQQFICQCASSRGAYQIVQIEQRGFEANELFHQMESFENDILKKCFLLILDRRYDTAIREASLVLETYLKQTTGSEAWGVNLVNDTFGSKGIFGKNFSDDGKRQGMRDLLAGVMSIIRNDYAHNFRSPTRSQTMAIIGFINILLQQINDIANKQ